MTAPRVLFWVQHLLGVGHLYRAATLARALAGAGFAVDVASGGSAVPEADFGAARLHPLPPARVAGDGDWVLLDAAGRPVDEAWRGRRRDRLLALYESVSPDIIVIEMFPFGRRQFGFELLPLLGRARAGRKAGRRPAVVCSVRDILQTGRRPGRDREAAETAASGFDLVLVHGDPALVGFPETFPEAARIAGLLQYTGLVVAPAAPPAATREGVLVSTGGGAVGLGLLRRALAARPLSRLARAPWRLLAGRNLSDAALGALRAELPDGVVVERSRPDFRALLAGAAVSVSQAGYNTVADVLAAATPAVLVPFAGGGETEQTFRATRLAARGLARTVLPAELDGASLARAIDGAAAAGPPARSPDLGGAARTVVLLQRLVSERRK